MFERVAPEQFDTLPEIPEPCENTQLVGHEDVQRLLATASGAGKLHHALLFVGPQGIGKATLAFHLAWNLFQRVGHTTETLAAPDPASQNFRLIAQGAHPSLMHLTRPFMEKERKFKTVITVEEIRRVGRFLSLTSHDGGYRVVIVDPAENMNNSAANALLKNLEEPPPQTLFILISHSPGRLLPTIRSRCQTLRFQPLQPPPLLALLQRLGAELPADPAVRQSLLERAGGSARNAILLTQYGGLEIAETTERILSAPVFEVDEAHRLGEAVSGRDKDVQFAIFNRNLLETLEKHASRRAAVGGVEAADRLAGLWEDVTGAIRDTETYNLDRRQHVIGLLGRVREMLLAVPGP